MNIEEVIQSLKEMLETIDFEVEEIENNRKVDAAIKHIRIMSSKMMSMLNEIMPDDKVPGECPNPACKSKYLYNYELLNQNFDRKPGIYQDILRCNSCGTIWAENYNYFSYRIIEEKEGK